MATLETTMRVIGTTTVGFPNQVDQHKYILGLNTIGGELITIPGKTDYRPFCDFLTKEKSVKSLSLRIWQAESEFWLLITAVQNVILAGDSILVTGHGELHIGEPSPYHTAGDKSLRLYPHEGKIYSVNYAVEDPIVRRGLLLLPSEDFLSIKHYGEREQQYLEYIEFLERNSFDTYPTVADAFEDVKLRPLLQEGLVRMLIAEEYKQGENK